jgi:hypothetical protein
MVMIGHFITSFTEYSTALDKRERENCRDLKRSRLETTITQNLFVHIFASNISDQQQLDTQCMFCDIALLCNSHF